MGRDEDQLPWFRAARGSYVRPTGGPSARQFMRFDPQVLHGVLSLADQRKELPMHNRNADPEMAVDSAARRGLESREVATTGRWLVTGTMARTESTPGATRKRPRGGWQSDKPRRLV
jgi:hypothetical protein